MDTEERFIKWLENMNYPGNIPKSLSKLINPSTAPLWEQLIENVKPKDEVEFMRNNIILNRLSEKNLDSYSNDLKTPIPEIETWKLKYKLEEELKKITNRIKEKDVYLEELSSQNKIKYIQLQYLEQKIKEKKKDIFLLKSQSKQLEKKLNKTKDLLTSVQNITPIESSEEEDAAMVLQTLNLCAEKLDQLITKQNKKAPKNRLGNFQAKSLFNLQNTNLPFTTPQSKMSSLFFTARKPNISRPMLTSTKKKVYTKLNFANDCEQNDSLGIINNIEESSLNLTCLTRTDSSFVHVSEILNNKELLSEIKNMLRNFSRFIIWKNICKKNDKLKVELLNAIIDDKLDTCIKPKIDNSDTAKLYSLHIKNELNNIKHAVAVNKLQQDVESLQTKIFESLYNNSSIENLEEIKETILLQLEDVGLTAMLPLLQQQVNSLRKSTITTNELQITKHSCQKFHDECMKKLNLMDHLVNTLKETQTRIQNLSEESRSNLEMFFTYTDNMDWLSCLSENVLFNEMNALFNFPLEYNRTTVYTECAEFHRDLFTDNLPLHPIEPDTLHKLSVLLDPPSTFPETILMHHWNRIIEYENLNNILNQDKPVISIKQYTEEELKNLDSYEKPIVEELNSIINSDTLNKIQNIHDSIQESVNIWKEMHFKKYISSERVVNGNNYEYYDKLYQEFYEQL